MSGNKNKNSNKTTATATAKNGNTTSASSKQTDKKSAAEQNKEGVTSTASSTVTKSETPAANAPQQQPQQEPAKTQQPSTTIVGASRNPPQKNGKKGPRGPRNSASKGLLYRVALTTYNDYRKYGRYIVNAMFVPNYIPAGATSPVFAHDTALDKNLASFGKNTEAHIAANKAAGKTGAYIQEYGGYILCTKENIPAVVALIRDYAKLPQTQGEKAMFTLLDKAELHQEVPAAIELEIAMPEDTAVTAEGSEANSTEKEPVAQA